MIANAPVHRYPAPILIRGTDVAAKAVLMVLLAIITVNPEFGHVQDKAATARAITYPMLALSVPTIWYVFWRERASFPWLADLLVTLTCFTDTLGNRMDLYDRIVWFDDLMHFMNTGFLTAAVIMLTMHRSSPLGRTIERALAFGVTAAVGWEIAEYFAFLSDSNERNGAYADTLSDIFLGSFGSVLAALILYTLWHRGRLSLTAPQLESHEHLRRTPEYARRRVSSYGRS